ncbi:MASE1 family protein, partial [Vibrio parahaemolyticus AQ3810]
TYRSGRIGKTRHCPRTA